MIHYFDIDTYYQPLPQDTANGCTQMTRAFLLYILRVYFFANGGQIVSLRWLSLFCDFGNAWGAN